MNGSSSTGSISSANRVRTAMALKIVPTATNPIVASAVTPRMPGSARPRLDVEEEHEERQGHQLHRAHEGEVGQQLAQKERLARHRRQQQPVQRGVLPLDVEGPVSATIAASANVTHSTLGARSVADSTVGSRAKLKTTSTSAAKTSADCSAVRLRSSARMSLAAMASASRSESGTDQPMVARQERLQRSRPRLVGSPATLDQHRHPGGELPRLGQMVGHQHHAQALGQPGLADRPAAGRPRAASSAVKGSSSSSSFGSVQQRPRDRRPLQQPAAQPPRQLVRPLPESRLGQRRLRRPRADGPAHRAGRRRSGSRAASGRRRAGIGGRAGRWRGGSRPSRRSSGWPSTRTSPAVGRMRPARILSSVVLPAPFGPTTARASPARSERSSPRRMRTRPKERWSPRASSSGAPS